MKKNILLTVISLICTVAGYYLLYVGNHNAIGVFLAIMANNATRTLDKK